MSEQLFCIECDELVNASVCEFRETMPMRGMEIEMTNRYPVCPVCGNRISAARYVDENLRALYERYREKADIPSAQEIVEMRIRYGFSQSTFAKVLGMGVASIQRYEKGSLPSESHAELLRSARSRNFVLKRLLAQSEQLGKTVFEKAMGSLAGASGGVAYHCIPWDGAEALSAFAAMGVGPESGFRRFDALRICETALTLAEQVDDLYVTKFNKVLFYLDFLSYRTREIGFTGLRYARLPYGPVPNDYEQLCAALVASGTIELAEKGDGHVLNPAGEAGGYAFSSDDRALLERVVAFANSFATTRELSEYSHRERAWQETGNGEIIDYGYARDLLLTLDG